MKQPSLNSPVFSRKSGETFAIDHVPIRKVHVLNCPTPIVYYMYPSNLTIVYCGCCLPTGSWFAVLKAGKHAMVEKASSHKHVRVLGGMCSD